MPAGVRSAAGRMRGSREGGGPALRRHPWGARAGSGRTFWRPSRRAGGPRSRRPGRAVRQGAGPIRGGAGASQCRRAPPAAAVGSRRRAGRGSVLRPCAEARAIVAPSSRGAVPALGILRAYLGPVLRLRGPRSGKHGDDRGRDLHGRGGPRPSSCRRGSALRGSLTAIARRPGEASRGSPAEAAVGGPADGAGRARRPSPRRRAAGRRASRRARRLRCRRPLRRWSGGPLPARGTCSGACPRRSPSVPGRCPRRAGPRRSPRP